jgi:hypothetical protein
VAHDITAFTVLKLLPLLVPFLDEVEDLWQRGGLTRQNVEEAALTGWAAAVALRPQLAAVPSSAIAQVVGGLSEAAVGAQVIAAAVSLQKRGA